MAGVKWRVLKFEPKILDVTLYNSSIIQGINSKYPPVARTEHMKISAAWKVQPTFSFIPVPNPRGVIVETHIQGYAANIWKWLRDGVRGHVIVPRGSGMLAFRPSGPGRVMGPSRPGSPSTGTVFTKRVWWPGIAPRNYDTIIAGDLQPIWVRIMREVLLNALRVSRR